MAKILLVDDQESVLTSLSILLRRNGHGVVTGENADEAVHRLSENHFDLVLTDIRMGDPEAGVAVLENALALRPGIPVILMTAYGTIENAVAMIKKGAFDYITKGFSNSELIRKINRALRTDKLFTEHDARPTGFEKIVGRSPGIVAAMQLAEKVAVSDSTILIEGESGTGKELIANAIHRLSPRAENRFLPINCAAFPDTLLESELFGHVRGSFTGADRDKQGIFSAAHKGTLFLDEVSEMSKAMQTKLLRVLQEGAVMPVGSDRAQRVDVRIISATNKNLQEEIRRKTFREDLYFRLCVVPITLPPLRERRGDIPLLARTFVTRFRRKFQRPEIRLDPGAMAVLANRHWRGNIRELENFMERLMLLTEKQILEKEDLLPHLLREDHTAVSAPSTLASTEGEHIRKTLDACRWNQSEAARRLGIGRTTLWRKMKSHGLEPPVRDTNSGPSL